MDKAKFQSMVRRILTEEIQKRVPEMNGNGVDPEKKNKTFSTDPNSRDSKTKDEMLAEIEKAVKGVNPSWVVLWDDHDDITIQGGDMVKVRVTPLWEDNFKIVFHPRNEDRLFFTGLTWKQVIEFVKGNLDQKNLHTGVKKARDKSWRNAEEDKDNKAPAGLNQKDKPAKKEVKDSSNREKNFNEKGVKKDADLPNQPMRPVEKDQKLQRDIKVQDPVKLRKRTPDKKLVVKQN